MPARIIEFDRVVAGYSDSLTILNETTLDARAGEITPELAADATIAAEMAASNRANVRRLLTALVRRDGRPPPPGAPEESIDIARTVVRRGVDKLAAAMSSKPTTATSFGTW